MIRSLIPGPKFTLRVSEFVFTLALRDRRGANGRGNKLGLYYGEGRMVEGIIARTLLRGGANGRGNTLVTD